MNIVITKLNSIANQSSLSASKIAKMIGVDSSYLYHVKSGRIKPGLKFYQGVVNAFPDLKPLVDAEIYGKTNYKHTEIPVRKTLLTRFLEAFK
jgi:hypothetical protein